MIKYLISKILCGVSIMSSAANTGELQLVLVGKRSETWGDSLEAWVLFF